MTRSTPRVAFLGNMNNNHFSMVRFLRERGVNAELLLYDHEFEHFHPAADTYDLGYQGYTLQLSWGSSREFLTKPAEQVRKDLAPYDVLIGCGLAPAYCERAGRRLDIFKPYGADLFFQTSYKLVSPQLLPSYLAAVYFQRRGIKNSRVFHMAVTNEHAESCYERFRGGSERWIEGLPMVHLPTYSPSRLESASCGTHWAEDFRRIRRENDLVVVYHGRHVWKCSPQDPNAKGTDRLLRGWAKFREQHPAVKAALVTLEYGSDLSHSKALIKELGISDSVFWLPRMYRKDLMVGLNSADIVCGEFQHSWMTSGVLYEALALGKPILAWREDTAYRAGYPNLYPILNARSSDEIAGRLSAFLVDRAGCRQLGELGRDWYDAEVVTKTLRRYVDFIERRASESLSSHSMP